MQYLLSHICRPVLVRLSTERTLCAFDFDGTLAPIVPNPNEAGLRDITRHLLSRLAAVYPCVVLSGRARADLLRNLRGVGVRQAIGNHGAEVDGISPTARRQVRKWKTVIESEIGPLPGVWVEDKGLSLAVHYRQSPQKAEARRQILKAARRLEHACVFGGKQVVNMVMDGAPGKREALAAERDRLDCTWVLFLGDDENDEQAFALEGDTVPVRVGYKRQSHARYYLRTQGEIDTLLERLVMLRTSV